MICVGGRALYHLARQFLQAEQSSSRQNLLEWLDECCTRFGDIVRNVPQNYPENPALGRWCQNIRQDYKKNKLAQDKIKRLDDLGFSWSLRKVET